MYAYCHDALGLTDHEAFNRIEVARAGRRFCLVLDRLAEGAVSLTAVRLLAPHLTAENHAEVLESARGLTPVGGREDRRSTVAHAGRADDSSEAGRAKVGRGNASSHSA